MNQKEDFGKTRETREREEHFFEPGSNGSPGTNGSNGTHSRAFPNMKFARKLIRPPEVSENEEQTISLPFDPWRLVRALGKRWVWLLGAGILVGGLAFLAGMRGASETAFIRLIRREANNPFKAMEAGDSFRPRELSPHTFAGLMTSPEIFSQVASKFTNAPVDVGRLAGRVRIKPEGETDFITIMMAVVGSKEETIQLLNLYAEEVVNHMRKMQELESFEMNQSLSEQLKLMDLEFDQWNAQVSAYSKTNQFVDVTKETEALLRQRGEVELELGKMHIDAKIVDIKTDSYKKELAKYNPANERLRVAQQELGNLLVKWTEIHPDVISKKAQIVELQKQLKAPGSENRFEGLTGNPAIDALMGQVAVWEADKSTRTQRLAHLKEQKLAIEAQLGGLTEKGLGYATLKTRLDGIDATRKLLQARQREAGLYQENALGHYRIFSKATVHNVVANRKLVKATAFGFIGTCLGIFFAAAFILLTEVTDARIKTVADLERVTNLPVLMTLGDLNKMSPAAKANWAFRAWTLISGRLTSSPNHGMVCGFISSTAGEGRSTWINLLVEAASQRGLKVLTVATKPSPPVVESQPAKEEPKESPHNPFEKKPIIVPEADTENPLTNSFLAKPAEVSQQLTEPNSQAVVHIPLPGWVWNLERRKQWQGALDHWKTVENVVMLVELPPACQPESVLLAENLPQVIWLADSGKAEIEETQLQLETLRHARCNIVGAVLNHEPSPVKNPLTRWLRRFTTVLLFTVLPSGFAQTTPEKNGGANAATTSIAPKRAGWQEKLTLGPGDILNFTLYGETNSLRSDVPVGPDGRVSYLQATDVMAAGLTVDELRARMDQELGKYFRAPRTMITPVAFRSKRYYVLGQVATRGAFPLDRPTTVIEAIATAKGVETGMMDRNAGELADLSRAFIVRGGKRLEVDFERLFQQGDFSQNILLEPGDYLFFPSAAAREVYVLGEVLTQGPVPLSQAPSTIGAIASRGGFTPKAWKDKILVIRGSLNNPETFIVEGRDVLGGAKADFKLQARDIIYISRRPWARVEELLDTAATSFIQGAVTAWVGVNVGPIIRKPILPDL